MKKGKILNLTQHEASEEQKKAGVIEPAEKGVVKNLLTFDTLPSQEELKKRAFALAKVCYTWHTPKAMIGGAPYLMAPLEKELKKRGITPLYAFSKRESVETVQPDGSTKKEMVFRHLGFVEV